MITEANTDLQSDDAKFIADTWLKSYRAACDGGSRALPAQDLAQYVLRNMDDQGYFELMRPHVHRLMTDPDNDLLLMSEEVDRDLYVGWVCGRKAQGTRPAVLHYVYIKKRHRKEGHCYKLIAELLGERMGAQGFYTCQTWEWFQVALDQSNIWTYKPKLATKGADAHDQQTATTASP